MQKENTYTAFAGSESVASGDRTMVSTAAAELLDSGDQRTLLIFDDRTGSQTELGMLLAEDMSPERRPSPEITSETVGAESHAPVKRRSPGRPKLGVVGREVTLLPRHWRWLNAQPGGASVALRKLVEQARRDNAGKDRVRRSQEAAFRFMSAMAGNEPGFEEASRALFSGDAEAFGAQTEAWPPDVSEYALALAKGAFSDG